MIRHAPGAGPEDGACSHCVRGEVWYSPSGDEIRLCFKHSRIVKGVSGWRKAGVQNDQPIIGSMTEPRVGPVEDYEEEP